MGNVEDLLVLLRDVLSDPSVLLLGLLLGLGFGLFLLLLEIYGLLSCDLVRDCGVVGCGDRGRRGGGGYFSGDLVEFVLDAFGYVIGVLEEFF